MLIVKKVIYISLIFILPCIAMAQDDVKLDKKDNKKGGEKSGRLDNPAIRKSRKDMDKQSAKMDKKKYRSRVKHVKPKGGDDNQDKPDKKEQKKEL